MSVTGRYGKKMNETFIGFRATIIQHQSARVGHANVGSVALPAVLRAGDAGSPSQFQEGSLQKAQHSQLSSQMPVVNGHVSPSVSFLHDFSFVVFELFWFSFLSVCLA